MNKRDAMDLLMYRALSRVGYEIDVYDAIELEALISVVPEDMVSAIVVKLRSCVGKDVPELLEKAENKMKMNKGDR